MTYQTFKAQMGDSPIYPALDDHDSLRKHIQLLTPSTILVDTAMYANAPTTRVGLVVIKSCGAVVGSLVVAYSAAVICSLI